MTALETATIAYKMQSKVFVGVLGKAAESNEETVVEYKEISNVDENNLRDDKLYVVMSGGDELKPKLFILDDLPLIDSEGKTIATARIENSVLITAGNVLLKSFKHNVIVH